MQIVLFSLCTLFTNCYICCRQCINQYDGGRAKIKDDYHSPLTLWYVSTASQLSISWILPHVCRISSLTVSLLYLLTFWWRMKANTNHYLYILNIEHFQSKRQSNRLSVMPGPRREVESRLFQICSLFILTNLRD